VFALGLEDVGSKGAWNAVRMRTWLVVCGVFAVLSARAGISRAQDAKQSEEEPSDIARAEGIAAEAYEAYARQDYAQAVALYRRALAASPSPDILYNLARIYDTRLKDRESAIEFYERYTQDPGADPERARSSLRRLARLRELEKISDDTPPADPQKAGPSPEGGEAPAPEHGAAEPSAGINGMQVASIIVGTVGLAGAGVGIGFGLHAKSKADLSHQLCDGNSCFSPRGVDAAKDASKAATISTIAFVAGGTLVAAGVTLLIIGSTGKSEREAQTQLIPYVDRYGGGTALIGRW
jgi:Tetratricopeptide repeat